MVLCVLLLPLLLFLSFIIYNMIKKLLILPILWGLMSFCAFASAWSITFTSDWSTNSSYYQSSITIDWSISDLVVDNFEILDFNSFMNDAVLVSLQIDNSDCSISSSYTDHYRTAVLYNRNWNSCPTSPWTYPISAILTNYHAPFKSITISSSNIVVPSDDSSSTLVPTIPSSFTTWLTNLVSNFWSTIVLRLPTIILVALWIYAIFSLFRVIRWYSKSAFRW